MKIGRREIIGFFLMLLFVGFTVSGIVLIDVVFTVAPFTIYGYPIKITMNLGFIFILLGLFMLALLLRVSGKR